VRGGPFKKAPLAKGGLLSALAPLKFPDHAMAKSKKRRAMFGPCSVMQAFETEAEAIELAKQIAYGTACLGLPVHEHRPSLAR